MELTPELVLSAYAQGYFPMAKSRNTKEIYWFTPEQRGILPLGGFHLPRSLKKLLKQQPFTLTLDKDFPAVIHHCATAREDSWINPEIERLYIELQHRGFAHSVECWQENRLVGGLYGVALAGAFFGESMFSLVPNASKIALAHLVEWLKAANYTLLDTQYVNEHLLQFGVQEIPRAEYLTQLKLALMMRPQPLIPKSLQELAL